MNDERTTTYETGRQPVLFLFRVFREGDGIFFEDLDEDIVEEGFHDLVRALEGRAGIRRRREIIREFIEFLDDIAGTGMFIFQRLDVVQRCLIRMGMLAHEREDEPFFFSTPVVYKNSQIKTVVKATVFEIFRKKLCGKM